MSLLHAYGCHIMQGYYFSKPVPAAEFARFRLEYGGQTPKPTGKPGAGSKLSLLQAAAGGLH
jgi:predicted signal transduction protein with EAL and GGDEF domain